MYSITPFTRTTYSHLNPHLNPYPNSVPFTRPSRKASLVMQAALFHVTRASAMVFAKLLQLLLLYFWLRAIRRRRIRAKRRRLSSWDHAFTASASLRWRSTARTTAEVCARLLEGSRINRQLWVRPRSSSFYQDTAAVQGWSDAEFKGNFRVSRPTFAYLVSELKPTLERQDFLRSSIPVSLQCCPLFAPIVPTLVENEEKRAQLQIHR